MEGFDKEVPINDDDDQVAIMDGLGSVTGGAGALAPGGVHGHHRNSLEGLSGAAGAAGAAEEEIGGLYDDGYANKSADESVGEGRRVTMEEIQGAVEQLTKGQDPITKKLGLLIGALASQQGQPVSSATRAKPLSSLFSPNRRPLPFVQ